MCKVHTPPISDGKGRLCNHKLSIINYLNFFFLQSVTIGTLKQNRKSEIEDSPTSSPEKPRSILIDNLPGRSAKMNKMGEFNKATAPPMPQAPPPAYNNQGLHSQARTSFFQRSLILRSKFLGFSDQ